MNATLSIEEGARLLGVSEATARRWIAERRLQTVKVGRVTKLRRRDLEAVAWRLFPPPRRERRRGSVAQAVHRVQRCPHERWSHLSRGWYDPLIRPAPARESTPPFTAIPQPDRRRRHRRTERHTN